MEENVSWNFPKDKKSSFLNSTSGKVDKFGRDCSGKQNSPNIKLDKIVLEKSLSQENLQDNVTTRSIEKNSVVLNTPTEIATLPALSILNVISEAKEITNEEYTATAAITELIPSKTTILNSPNKAVILNYVVVELNTALQELKELIEKHGEEKRSYVINAYILLCNGSSTHDMKDLKMNYKLSFILGNPTISNVQGLQFNTQNLSIKSLYDVLFSILIIAKPTILYNNQLQRTEKNDTNRETPFRWQCHSQKAIHLGILEGTI